ncbi:MAG TPA: aldo/keto reductase [Mycobacteriales bacterium]|nr:aldo/keto reductase [Mycobacteriales bacterium]
MAVTGLGLAAIGRPAYITSGRERDLPGERSRDELRARAHDLLDHAYAQGIRYVDAARSYGDAEQFLGSWLRRRDVPDVFVASKWGYAYVGGWRRDAEQHEVKRHDLATFERQLAETRALLGDRLRLYQVHSVTPDSPLLTDRPLLDRLAALRDSGVEIGVSTSGPDQAGAIERVLALGLFSSVQATWNLLETSAGPALAAAHDAGWRVVVKEGVANGRLAVDVPAPLAAVAAARGVGPDAVALSAVAAQPWCDVVLSGAVTPEQLTSNATAVPLTADELAALGDLAEPAAGYWAARSRRAWT